MKTKLVTAIAGIIAFFYWLPEPSKQIPTESKPVEANQHGLNENFIIRNVRFYDGYQLLENVDVVIEQHKISKIADHLPQQKLFDELDGTGKTLLPGFVDAHTHAYGNALGDALNFGVTTELDMFTMPSFANPEQKLRDSLDNTEKADLFSSTILATTSGGHGTEYGFSIPVLTAPSQVEDFVSERIDQGADYIKAVYNSVEAKRQFFPSISKAILAELIKQAHQRDVMLLVHVDNLISATEAIELGADGVVHNFMDSVVDQKFVELMKKSKSFMVATLSVEGAIVGKKVAKNLLANSSNLNYLNKLQKKQLRTEFPDFGIPDSAFEKAKKSVAILTTAGVTVLVGTDAPNPGTTHGLSLHGELVLMVEAGLTPLQAIHRATGAVSDNFSIGKRGTLKPGALASMVLIEGNPFKHIELTQNISHIWKNGLLFKRRQFNQQAVQLRPIKKGLINDFNQSLKKTQIGRGLFETSDKLAGGNSEVKLELIPKQDRLDKYLHVTGELKNGFMFVWAGVSFIPGESQQRGADFSQIKSISFDAKAGAKTANISVLLFEQGSFQPSARVIKLTKQWKSYSVDLNDFNNVDLSAISNISIVVNETKGEYEFMLDNLKLD